MPPSANFCDSVTTDKPGPSSLTYLCNTEYTSVLSPAALAALISADAVPQDGQCYTTVCAYSGPAAEAFAAARLAANGYGSTGLACVYAGSSFQEVYASIMNWKPPAVCLGTPSSPKTDAGAMPQPDAGAMCAMLQGACDPNSSAPEQTCCDGLSCDPGPSQASCCMTVNSDVFGYECQFDSDCCQQPFPTECDEGRCCLAEAALCVLDTDDSCCPGLHCTDTGAATGYGTCEG